MVLTRRQRKALSSLIRLPNELLIEVIHDVPETALPSLCRVSKLLHGLTLPFLNCDVVLVVPRSPFIAFCSALIANPTRGAAIRSLTIRRASNRELDLLVEAMKLMSRLEKLHLSLAALGPKLSLLTFPRLLTCTLLLFSSFHNVVAFLTRHTTITHLTARLGGVYSSIPTISLPGLRYLEAPPHIFKRVVSPSLPAMRLFWSHTEDVHRFTYIDQTVSSFKDLTNPDAPSFVSYQHLVDLCGTACTDILDSLSRHMQYTTSLCVRVDSIEYALYVAPRLPRFSKLQYLALECHFDDLPVPHAKLSQAWEIVKNTVDAGIIGALKACRIDHTAWKRVDGVWAEYPEEEFQMQAGLSAFAVSAFQV